MTKKDTDRPIQPSGGSIQLTAANESRVIDGISARFNATSEDVSDESNESDESAGIDEARVMLQSNVDDDDDDDDDGDDLDVLPIDKGWAWVILAGGTFEVFVFGGLMKSYGVFFVEFQKRFGSSASETNVMQTIHNIIVSISGVLVANVGLKYMSPRTSVVIGSVALSLSYLISAFVTDIRIMSLTIGLMSGIANVMLYLPLVTTIGTYFKKHRGLANSIHVSGSSIGALVFGPFYTAVFDYYGYTGTMMIVSAILFNSVISGLLIRPVSFYRNERKWKKRKRTKNTIVSNETDTRKTVEQDVTDSVQSEDSLEITNINGPQNMKKDCLHSGNEPNPERKLLRLLSERDANIEKDKENSASKGTSLYQRALSYDPSNAKIAAFPSPTLGRLSTQRKRTNSEMSHTSIIENVIDSISRSKVAMYASGDIACDTMSLGTINAIDEDDGSHVTSRNDVTNTKHYSKKTYASTIVNFLKTVFDLSVFCPVFVHFLCIAAVVLTGTIMMSVYLIPYAKEIGATSGDISIIFIVISSIDLVSRLSVGVVADRKWLRPTTIVAISSAILGVACHVIRFVSSFWTLVVLAIIQGAFGGTYMCLYNVIQIEHLGLDKFKRSVGFVGMCHGVSLAVFFQLTGLLRDKTGNYVYTYHLVGTLLFIGSALSLTLPLMSSFVDRRKQPKKPDDTAHKEQKD